MMKMLPMLYIADTDFEALAASPTSVMGLKDGPDPLGPGNRSESS